MPVLHHTASADSEAKVSPAGFVGWVHLPEVRSGSRQVGTKNKLTSDSDITNTNSQATSATPKPVLTKPGSANTLLNSAAGCTPTPPASPPSTLPTPNPGTAIPT